MQLRLLAMTVSFLIIGCGAPLPSAYDAETQKGKNYSAALDAVKKSAPFVSDFERLFPTAQVRYRYFSKGPGPGFDAVVILHERYELTMQLPVEFDAAGRAVVGYGEPVFYLVEAARVDGRSVLYDSTGARQFGLLHWRKLVDANGNFDAINYAMKKDRPVPGFSRFTNVPGP